jgi:hypothetical protein
MFTKEVFAYVVTLKNNTTRYIDTVGFIVTILSVIFFTGEYFINKQKNVLWLIAAAAQLCVIAFTFFQRRRRQPVSYKPAFIFAAITWLSMPYLQWVCILLLVLYFLEYPAKLPQEIGFSENKIVINSLFNRTIYWNELNNVVFKDNLLTIDFKNNKLIQKEVLDDDEPDADEDEFNEYCNKCLKSEKAKGKR